MRKQPSATVHPIEQLRDLCTALEAAVLVAMAQPKKEAVHRLRTGTRRIEAQLELLEMLSEQHPGLRNCAKPAARVRKELRRLRRSAGAVRDLDVQRKMMKDAASKAGTAERKEARALRSTLKARRDKEAQALVEMLEARRDKLSRRIEKLMAALEPALGTTVSESHLQQSVRRWFAQRTRVRTGTKKSLHGLRKAAKLARYMAESGGESRAAAQFQQTQQLGGAWHDRLMLRETTEDALGSKAPLVQRFAQSEASALGRFRAQLDDSEAER